MENSGELLEITYSEYETVRTGAGAEYVFTLRDPEDHTRELQVVSKAGKLHLVYRGAEYGFGRDFGHLVSTIDGFLAGRILLFTVYAHEKKRLSGRRRRAAVDIDSTIDGLIRSLAGERQDVLRCLYRLQTAKDCRIRLYGWDPADCRSILAFRAPAGSAGIRSGKQPSVHTTAKEKQHHAHDIIG